MFVVIVLIMARVNFLPSCEETPVRLRKHRLPRFFQASEEGSSVLFKLRKLFMNTDLGYTSEVIAQIGELSRSPLVLADRIIGFGSPIRNRNYCSKEGRHRTGNGRSLRTIFQVASAPKTIGAAKLTFSVKRRMRSQITKLRVSTGI